MYLISKLWSKISSLTEQLKSHFPELNEGLETCSCACDIEIFMALEKQELKLAHSNCKYDLIIIVSVISCNSFSFVLQHFYFNIFMLAHSFYLHILM